MLKRQCTRQYKVSPSPRKAWIETGKRQTSVLSVRKVAFPPEGVD